MCKQQEQPQEQQPPPCPERRACQQQPFAFPQPPAQHFPFFPQGGQAAPPPFPSFPFPSQPSQAQQQEQQEQQEQQQEQQTPPFPAPLLGLVQHFLECHPELLSEGVPLLRQIADIPESDEVPQALVGQLAAAVSHHLEQLEPYLSAWLPEPLRAAPEQRARHLTCHLGGMLRQPHIRRFVPFVLALVQQVPQPATCCCRCRGPLPSIRYRCAVCADCVLCQECRCATAATHDPTHHFVEEGPGSCGCCPCKSVATPDPARSAMAELVRHVNVEPGSYVEVGGTYVKQWLVRNSGPVAWPSGSVLRFVSGDATLSPSQHVPVTPIAPGTTGELAVEIRATEPRRWTALWQVQAPDGTPFGQVFEIDITAVM
eukprot:TRINITY_DN4598_c0_g1_i3.p1 TRINITY_DN4598_c0_g1~~TRINITY_DN4598_c0_g1_i3.p1  ORF type:complete len:371 (+),score=89.88 TRINITY_DN4598_c0_g1_i3:724-1836(+)